MVETVFQGALYDKLNGASLGAQGVYDVAPQQSDSGDTSVFPYVTIGHVVMTELDSQTTVGFSALVRIHTFSRSGSMLECKNIQGAIFAALHRKTLTMTGYNNYSLLRESTDCTPDENGKFHGVCEYRALIEESA